MQTVPLQGAHSQSPRQSILPTFQGPAVLISPGTTSLRLVELPPVVLSEFALLVSSHDGGDQACEHDGEEE